MFTIDQLKAAHAKVKSGADFPRYIQDINNLGVTSYTSYVNDGHTVFTGKDNYQIQWEAKYAVIEIASQNDPEALVRSLKIHQQGGTDYLTFCRQAANAGVATWTVSINEMTCTYCDSKGKILLVEQVAEKSNKG